MKISVFQKRGLEQLQSYATDSGIEVMLLALSLILVQAQQTAISTVYLLLVFISISYP